MIYSSKEKCTACGACINKCPVSAIEFKKDNNGFEYPVVDESICIDCDLCKQVCVTRNANEFHKVMESKVVVLKSKYALKQSSSGGLFYGLAKTTIENKGVVFGASYIKNESNIRIGHILVDSIKDIEKIQGSKYARSDIGLTYKEAENFLKSGKQVLFSGTPCQIAGLYQYLGKSYENLFTADIICHGVPEQEIFQKYIKYLEKKQNAKIVDFCFRSKKYGWGHVCGQYTIKRKSGRTKRKKLPSLLSSYYNLYLHGKINRENCYDCVFAQEERVADITMGDYWGIQREHPKLLRGNGGMIEPKYGVSCCLINTPKGLELFKAAEEDFYCYKSSIEKIVEHNSRLKERIKRAEKDTNNFSNLKDYNEIENIFWESNKKYLLWKRHLMKRLRVLTPQRIRSIVNKLKK